MSSTAETDAFVKLAAKPLSIDGGVPCPLCHELLKSMRQYQRHVGRHQEQLSLFALPSSEPDEESNRNENDSDESNSATSKGKSEAVGNGSTKSEENQPFDDHPNDAVQTGELPQRQEEDYEDENLSVFSDLPEQDGDIPTETDIAESLEQTIDPDKIHLEAEIAAFKAAEEKLKAAQKQKEIEAQIRKDAEEAFETRMEAMTLAQLEAQKQIEEAKMEAEKAARERIAAERKAEEGLVHKHAESMKEAEEKARIKFEFELKAVEEARKREAESRAKTEADAKAKFEAEMRAAEARGKMEAEERARAEAELKAAEERKKIEYEERERTEKVARLQLEMALTDEPLANAEAVRKVLEEAERLYRAEQAAKVAAAEAEAEEAAHVKKMEEENEVKVSK